MHFTKNIPRFIFVIKKHVTESHIGIEKAKLCLNFI